MPSTPRKHKSIHMIYAFLIIFAFFWFAMISSLRHQSANPGTTEAPPWMRRMPLLPFVIFAAAGFILSLIAHLLSILGVRQPGGDIVFFLHMGIFVIWIPAVFLSQGRRNKDILDQIPRWMKYTISVLFVYALLNFAYFMTVAPKRGSKEINQHPAPAKVVRGFSGHWMIFYGAGFAMLWKAWKDKKLQSLPITGRDLLPKTLDE